MIPLPFFALTILLLTFPRVIQAAQLQVPADYPTIRTALEAAVAHDTVRVADGTYNEWNLPLVDRVTLLGNPQDPAQVTIDAGNQGRVLVALDLPNPTRISGFRLIHGDASTNLGIDLGTDGNALASYSSDLTLEHCIIEDCGGNGTTLLLAGNEMCYLRSCIIRDNPGGVGARFKNSVPAIVDSCRIEGNGSGLYFTTLTQGLVRNSVIANNLGTGITCYGSGVTVRQSTVTANRGNGIHMNGDRELNLQRSIIAFNRGIAVRCDLETTLGMTCCDVYGNIGGDYVDCLWDFQGSGGNLEIEPRFCDPTAGDWALAADSPCLASLNSCGTNIGPFGAACDTGSLFLDAEPAAAAVGIGEALRFINWSGPADSWAWDFDGNGTIDSTLPEPQWTYPVPGSYPVRLVAAQDGLQDTLDLEQPVIVYHSGTIRIPEDFADLAAAMPFAADGDTISIAPGIHLAADLETSRRIVVAGRGGDPRDTILDAQGAYSHFHPEYDENIDLQVQDLCLRGAAGRVITMEDGSVRLRGCLITGNGGLAGVYGNTWGTQSVVLENCTVSGNAPVSALIEGYDPPDTLRIDGCLFAFNQGVPLLPDDLAPGYLQVACTDIHSGTGAPGWTGALAALADTPGNLDADPWLSDPGNGDFRLAQGSACLPEGNACNTRIGCLGEGLAEPVTPAWFWLEPYGDVIPQTVRFHSHDHAMTLGREWDMDGDGVFDVPGQDPQWTYSAPGTYSVTLNVMSENGELRSLTRESAVVLGGRVLRVPGEYTRIVDALEAAAPGDTVDVECGTYTEINLELPAGVVLRGALPGQACVTIDAEGDGRIMDATNAVGARIEGIRFINGNITGEGGAILGRDMAGISHCEFVDNSATTGGALRFDWATDCIIGSCLFTNNHATSSGGAISGFRGEIQDCRFEGNTAGSYGGALSNVGSRNVTGCRFTGNSAESGGAVSSGYSRYIDCEFTGNEAHDGYGGAVYSEDPDLLDCRLLGNHASVSGGAVYGSDPYVGAPRTQLEGCLLAGNSADGGGSAVMAIARLVMTDCTVVANDSPTGAALQSHEQDYNPQIEGCVIALNTGGPAVQVDFPEGWGEFDVRWNCIWGNEGGNWTGLEDYQDALCNIEVDPLFCDPESGNWYLLPESPCRSNYNPCNHPVGYSQDDCATEVVDRVVPAAFRMDPVFPNPFNPQTRIRIVMPEAGPARITVYNILGQMVREVHAGRLDAGTHEFVFDGSRLASGVYLVRAETGHESDCRRMLLLK